jgi:hypothetical protein
MTGPIPSKLASVAGSNKINRIPNLIVNLCLLLLLQVDTVPGESAQLDVLVWQIQDP